MGRLRVQAGRGRAAHQGQAAEAPFRELHDLLLPRRRDRVGDRWRSPGRSWPSPFTFKVDTVDKVLAPGAQGDRRRPSPTTGARRYRAAAFCLDNNVNLDEARTWLEKSVAVKETMYNLTGQARVLAIDGKKADAIALAKKAIAVGKAADPKADTAMVDNLIKEWEKYRAARPGFGARGSGSQKIEGLTPASGHRAQREPVVRGSRLVARGLNRLRRPQAAQREAPPSKTRGPTIGRAPQLGACSRAAAVGPDARKARRPDRSVAGGYVRIRTAAARRRRSVRYRRRHAGRDSNRSARPRTARHPTTLYQRNEIGVNAKHASTSASAAIAAANTALPETRLT